MDNPINYWYQKYLAEKLKNEGMVEALRTEYEKGRADVFSQMQKEWSEEDVYNSKLILSTINQDQDLSLETKNKLSSWVKFLKNRVQLQNYWKPTDKQMNTLHDAIVYVEGCNSNFKGNGSVLENLYNDLKKLIE